LEIVITALENHAMKLCQIILGVLLLVLTTAGSACATAPETKTPSASAILPLNNTASEDMSAAKNAPASTKTTADQGTQAAGDEIFKKLVQIALLLQIGQKDFMAGDYTNAIKNFAAVLDSDPNNVTAQAYEKKIEELQMATPAQVGMQRQIGIQRQKGIIREIPIHPDDESAMPNSADTLDAGAGPYLIPITR
jgi:hypothetical protein